MIFLEKNGQKLTINRHFSENCTKITLFNRFTKETIELSDLDNVSDNDFFYVFEGIDLSDIIDGEYILTLYNDDNVAIETMLAVCGDYQKEINSYQNQNNERKVYERYNENNQ